MQGNLHDQRNRDIDHRVYGNRGISMVCLNSQTMGISLCTTRRRKTTLLMNCSCGGHLSLHTRDIDHLVQELQLWKHHGLLNSKTMGIHLCTTTGKTWPLKTDIKMYPLSNQTENGNIRRHLPENPCISVLLEAYRP